MIALLLSTIVVSGAQEQLAATDSKVMWEGRTVRDEAAGTVTYAWAGVGFTLDINVAATTTTATAPDDAPLLSVLATSTFSNAGILHVYATNKASGTSSIQNVSLPTSKNKPSAMLVPLILPGTLKAGVSYTVRAIYITDPITLSWPVLPGANVQIAHSFQFGKGVSVAAQPPTPLKRRLDIYGDSITAGNQINATTCAPDWSGTYGRLLCDDFGANCTVAAISGKGIFHNCCDNNETMNAIGLRKLPGDPSTKLTASDWTAAGAPAGIVINLGTNDWGHVKTNTSGFVAVYQAFVEELVKIHAPAKPIFFFGAGPITHDYEPAVKTVIANIAPKGIKAHYIDHKTPTDRCGHPPYASHYMMYQQARPVIASALSWD